MNILNPNYRITPELVGVHCLNFGIRYNSPSRSQMMAGHLTSKLVIAHPEPVRTQSGGEHEFGKYTADVKMPANGRIICTIDRYPRGVGEGNIGFNPETLVIFENTDTLQLDCFVIPYFTSYHQHFGYKNHFNSEAINRLIPGAGVKKGTVFAHSPGLGPYNNYMYGRNLKVALMNWPGVSEDGIVISRDVLPLFKFHIYETRTVNFGSNTYPRLIYGNSPMPEIGQEIREDGMLMALSTYDEDLAPVEMGIHDMKTIGYNFDRAVYARETQSAIQVDGSIQSKPGRVVDIKVVKNNETVRNLPPLLAEPFDKYARANKRYFQSIVKVINDLSIERKKKYKDNRLNLSPKLHNLMVRARAMTNFQHPDAKGPLNLMVNQNPVDEYMVTFVIEYEMTPNIGYKLTGKSGDME